MKFPPFAIFFLCLMSCAQRENTTNEPFHRRVNPFIGTGGHGHTYPGATSPFGMVQLSPDTRIDGWDGCGGYHYSDSVIFGFSHTHLQGTGVSDYGDILMMPCTQFQPGKSDWRDRYASTFSHQSEAAHAGWYSVHLDEHQLEVQLTSTPRTGIQRIVLDAPDTLTFIIDMGHRDEVLEYSIYPIDDSTIVGHRVSDNWAREQHVYFAARFSAPFEWQDQLSEIRTLETRSDGRLVQEMEYVPVFAADFGTIDSLIVRTALSFVDIEGALSNLRAEAPHNRFETYRKNNEQAWDDQLGRIEVKGGTDADQEVFYTALYHSCTVPNLASDVDGRYRGTDMAIHELDQSEGQHYTVFSLWDTFRALHPLLNWIEPERTRDFIRTFLRMYQQGGQLPVWELASNYTGCMIGYHSVPVISDAWIWGIKDWDEELALEAMIQAADSAHLGLPAYRDLGYIPSEMEHESVSKTLEYAFDDWCIAQFAIAAGATDSIAERFTKRSCSWRNLYNPKSFFIQPKRGGAFVEGFDPREVNFNYTEANGWQYTFFMPHDVNTLMEYVGGDDAMVSFLDQMFESETATTGREQADITGLIGQYAHGNEPSHHMAYLYAYAGRPDRTHAYVEKILSTLYSPAPDGLSGNEDCGQMSAWYVWSALGLYPVAPASGELVVGKPKFESVEIRPKGRPAWTFVRSGQGPLVQSLGIDGRTSKKASISVQELLQGGKMVWNLGEELGFGHIERPTSHVNCPSFVAVPIIEAPRTFRSEINVALNHLNPDAQLQYRLSEADPWNPYYAPFQVNGSCTIEARAIDGDTSAVVSHRMMLVDHEWNLVLEQGEFSHQYHAGGPGALVDGIKGGPNFKTGEWQGYFGQNVVATLDLGKPERIASQCLGTLRDVRPWIMLPKEVRYYESMNGKDWDLIERITHRASDRDEEVLVLRFETKRVTVARYLKVEVDGYGPLPEHHLGVGNPSWLFLDEWEVRTR